MAFSKKEKEKLFIWFLTFLISTFSLWSVYAFVNEELLWTWKHKAGVTLILVSVFAGYKILKKK